MGGGSRGGVGGVRRPFSVLTEGDPKCRAALRVRYSARLPQRRCEERCVNKERMVL